MHPLNTAKLSLEKIYKDLKSNQKNIDKIKQILIDNPSNQYPYLLNKKMMLQLIKHLKLIYLLTIERIFKDNPSINNVSIIVYTPIDYLLYSFKEYCSIGMCKTLSTIFDWTYEFMVDKDIHYEYLPFIGLPSNIFMFNKKDIYSRYVYLCMIEELINSKTNDEKLIMRNGIKNYIYHYNNNENCLNNFDYIADKLTSEDIEEYLSFIPKGTRFYHDNIILFDKKTKEEILNFKNRMCFKYTNYV
jgi:hypothetical protein